MNPNDTDARVWRVTRDTTYRRHPYYVLHMNAQLRQWEDVIADGLTHTEARTLRNSLDSGEQDGS